VNNREYRLGIGEEIAENTRKNQGRRGIKTLRNVKSKGGKNNTISC